MIKAPVPMLGSPQIADANGERTVVGYAKRWASEERRIGKFHITK